MILVYDTETTGLINFGKPIFDLSQPRLVQLGAILYDMDFKVRGELNLIVKPQGFEIPIEASNIHGITTDIANDCGIEEYHVLTSFLEFVNKATYVVAHNKAYDDKIMSRALMLDFIHSHAKPLCTMNIMRSIIGGKWPKLQAAYQYCFNQEFDGAHDAMADVRACGSILKHIVTNNIFQLP